MNYACILLTFLKVQAQLWWWWSPDAGISAWVGKRTHPHSVAGREADWYAVEHRSETPQRVRRRCSTRGKRFRM